MKLWILDTDHVSLIQREEAFVTKRFKKINISKVAVTVITVEEQMRGRLNSIRQASQSGKEAQIIFAYAQLRKTVDFYRDMNLLDFDRAASDRYAELSRQKIRIGTQDLRIAAIALSVDGILVTRGEIFNESPVCFWKIGPDSNASLVWGDRPYPGNHRCGSIENRVIINVI